MNNNTPTAFGAPGIEFAFFWNESQPWEGRNDSVAIRDPQPARRGTRRTPRKRNRKS